MKVKTILIETLLTVTMIITSCGTKNKEAVTVNDKAEVTSAEESSNEEANKDEDFVFRKVNPNMSKEEVINSEDKEPAYVSDDMVAYKTTIAGMDCELYYNFEDDKLNAALVHFTEIHRDYEEYVDDYYTMKDKLTAKYGKPLIDSEIWHDKDRMSEYKDQKGYAVANEWLTLSTTYQYNDRMLIVNELDGSDLSMQHYLRYYFENYVIQETQDDNEY